MKITFNEVSFRPYSDSSAVLAQKFNVLLCTYRKLKEQYGVKHLIFPADLSQANVLQDKTFYEWLSNLRGTQKSQILSVIKRPYSDKVEEDLTEVNALFSFENTDLEIEETTCIGLELADRMETSTISMDTDAFWRNTTLSIYSTDFDTEKRTQRVNIPNCCLEELPVDTAQWFENHADVQLLPSDIEPRDKPIHLSDDHGKDILLAFSKKIINSEYVCSVINSLEFHPTGRQLVKKCYPDGRIELVLYWTDPGYGIVVQTTGNNLRETEEIAEKIRLKFDK